MLPYDVECLEKNARHRFRWLIIFMIVISIEVTLLFATLINQMQPPSPTLIAIPTDTPAPGVNL